jgi:hypothetical protein
MADDRSDFAADLPHVRFEVDTKPTGFLKLLFIRTAWQLPLTGKIPEARPVPNVGETRRPENFSEDALCRMWSELWERTWYALRAADLTDVSTPLPRWDDISGEPDGVDVSAFHKWSWQFRELAHAMEAEELAADDLFAARSQGLRAVTVLPVAGDYVRRPAASNLIVSAELRRAPARYGSVLRSLPPLQPPRTED